MIVRSKIRYFLHLFKAITKQHHKELIPLLKTELPENGIAIDVGAHAGQFTKLFSKLAPKGFVYSFEPGSYALSIINKVVRIHRLKNVSIMPFGLSDSASEETLHIPIKSSGGIGFGLSHIGEDKNDLRKTQEESIKLSTLDEFVERNSIKKINLIKADIEGWEMRLLLGAKKSINNFKPAIFLEINDEFLQRANNSSKEMCDFLRDRGYKIYKIDNNGKIDSEVNGTLEKGNIWCIAS